MDFAITENRSRNKIHPKKFALGVACASITMMFAALSSAYIVRQSAGNWLEFELPLQFFYSAGVIVLSSLTLHGAYLMFKRKRKQQYRLLLIATFVLGLAFVALQYSGWLALTGMGVAVNGNPSGSFVYALSWIHAAHVIGGIAALIVAMLHGFILKFRVSKSRLLRLELTIIYWHFVDALWIYLLVFFILQR